MTLRGYLPRLVSVPAVLGLAIVVLPLAALLPKVQWATFTADITEPTTLAALALSTKCAVIAVAACVVFGVPLALVIARAPGWLSTLLRTIVTLPLVLPPLVGGVALLAVLGRTGILGPWLERIGVTIPFTPAAVVVAQTFVAMPFLVIAVEGALRSAGTEFEQAAAGLGAGRWRILTRITIPLIAPGLIAGIVLAFARSVGEFGATALLAGNKPGVTQTIPMAIYTAFNGVDSTRAAAMALSVLLIATALAALVIFPVARGSSVGVVQGRRAAEPDPADLLDTPSPTPAPSSPVRHGAPLEAQVEFSRPHFTLHAEIAVGPGRVLGLVGPNAAGKSTLLGLIAGHLRPAAGQIRVGERVLSSPRGVRAPQQRRIGMLTQQPRLFPHLSVIDNVAFGPRCQGIPTAAARSRARDLLTHVGLAHTARRRPSQLSGGQQQRVALARALATEPDLLLLDEPLAALDVATAPQIRRILAAEIARTQVTTILVTHHLLDVALLADEVAVMENGRITETAPVREFLRRPTSAFGAALTGIAALPHPDTGELLYVDADALTLDLDAREDDGPVWTGRVDAVDVVGARASARVRVGERFLTAGMELTRIGEVVPGQEVRIALRSGHRTGPPARLRK